MAQQQGYGGRSNPYDQRGAPSPQYGAPQYGGGQYNNHPGMQMGRDDYATSNTEMQPLTNNGSGEYSRQGDPNAILNACREIDRGISEIESKLNRVQSAQRQYLNDASGNKQSLDDLEAMTADTVSLYRNLIARVKSIKQKPESGTPRNAPQVGKVDRKLKETFEEYQQVEVAFRRQLEAQAARQYRIVRPDATDAEVQEAVQEPGRSQIFSQAMMQGNRQGQANSVRAAVQQRSEAIKKIESQIIELAEMFQDMDNLVMQQEDAVVNIEQKGEEVVEHMDKGNEQITTAIQSARNARKWKWWCLGICVLVVVIIVIVILIYKFVIQGTSTTTKNTTTTATKRFVLSDMIPTEKRVVSGQPWTPIGSKIVVPGTEWTPESDTASKAVARKMRSFIA